ncbi:MAG: efflux RND transporter permease subunit, partial [Cytophagales bacterium]|nr:efflux RND transporter permease subunit [Cytophagales bacterium]
MIDRLIELSIKNRYFVLFMVLILILYGSYSVTQLPIDALPDVTNNQVLIITQNPNLAPYEIEKFVTAPIE